LAGKTARKRTDTKGSTAETSVMLAALVQGQQLQHPLFHPEKGVKKKNSSKIATQ